MLCLNSERCPVPFQYRRLRTLHGLRGATGGSAWVSKTSPSSLDGCAFHQASSGTYECGRPTRSGFLRPACSGKAALGRLLRRWPKSRGHVQTPTAACVSGSIRACELGFAGERRNHADPGMLGPEAPKGSEEKWTGQAVALVEHISLPGWGCPGAGRLRRMVLPGWVEARSALCRGQEPCQWPSWSRGVLVACRGLAWGVGVSSQCFWTTAK